MKILILFTLLFSQFVMSSPLSAVDRVQSFDCILTHTMGVTRLKYEANNKFLVQGVRNRWIPVQYSLHSAGKNYETGQSHLTLSGGSLLRNQYLSLSASSTLTTDSSTANGSLFLTTLGGSVFAPQVVKSLPIGQFYCSSIVIK
jgi:hypothetical protein